MNTIIEKVINSEKIYADIKKNDDGRITSSTDSLQKRCNDILNVIDYDNEELFKSVKQCFTDILKINLDDSFESGFCSGILLGVDATNIIKEDSATDLFSQSVITDLYKGKNFSEKLKQSAVEKIDKIFYKIQSALDKNALSYVQKAREAAISHHETVAEIYFKKGLQTGIVLGIYAKLKN